MNISNITETIAQLSGAIDCLSRAQLCPMTEGHRTAIGAEIQRIFKIIADISESHAGGRR